MPGNYPFPYHPPQEGAWGTVRLRLAYLMEQRGLVNQFGEANAMLLARNLGLGYKTARKLVRGDRRVVSLDLIARLCTWLDVTPGELIHYKPWGQRPE